MRVLRGLGLFVAGAVVGLTATTFAQNQTPNRGIVGLNHVGLSVPDLDKAVEYYTKTMGFPEAFRFVNASGQVQLVYVQAPRRSCPISSTRTAFARNWPNFRRSPFTGRQWNGGGKVRSRAGRRQTSRPALTRLRRAHRQFSAGRGFPPPRRAQASNRRCAKPRRSL